MARDEQFLLFPQRFLPFWRTFPHFHRISNCRKQTFSVWESLKFVVWERVKEFQVSEINGNLIHSTFFVSSLAGAYVIVYI